MERRTRSKIDELGLNSEVDALLAKGVTYEDIAAYVEAQTGESIGKSSIARYNKHVQRRLAEIRAMRESADAIKTVFDERSQDGGETNTAELLLAVVQHNLLDKLTEGELKAKDLSTLSFAANDAVRSQVAVEKLKATERKRFSKAYQKVLEETKALLQNSGLWPSVEEVLLAGMQDAIGE